MTDRRPLQRLVSLRHEFPSEWHRLVVAPGTGPRSVTVDVAIARFPYFVQRREITITRSTIAARTTADAHVTVAVAPGTIAPPLSSSPWEGQAPAGPWTVSVDQIGQIEDLFLVLDYGAS